MIDDHFESQNLERWRGALQAGGSRPTPGAVCATSEQLWLTVRGELPAAERRAVVAHLAECPGCREDWRLTWELYRQQQAAEDGDPRGRVLDGPWGGLRKYAAQVTAAAAVLVVAVGLGMFFHRPPEPTFRGDRSVIETALDNGAGAPLVEEDATLPRDAFLLRWVPDVEGTTYRVKVTNDAGDPVHRSGWLDEPEYRVPPEALEGLASGEQLYWHLEIRRPTFEEHRLGSHAVRVE